MKAATSWDFAPSGDENRSNSSKLRPGLTRELTSSDRWITREVFYGEECCAEHIARQEVINPKLIEVLG